MTAGARINGNNGRQRLEALADPDAERQMLGSLTLGEPWAVELLLQADDARPVRPVDFTVPAHADVLRAALALHHDGRPIDEVSLAQRMRDLGPGTDPMMILADLAAAGAPSAVSLAEARDRVVELATRRRLRLACLAAQQGLERGRLDSAQALEQIAGAGMAAPRPAPSQLADRWGTVGSLDQVPEPARWLFRLPTRDGATAPPGGGDGFLRRGCVASLVGSGGSGKTMALLDAGIAVATGGRWLNYFPIEGGPGRVLALLGEEDHAEVRRRVYRATRHLEPDQWRMVEQNLVVLPMKGRRCGLLRPGDDWPQPTQVLMELLARLRADAGPRGWALVILEPLSRVAGVSLDVTTDNATAIIEVAEQLTELAGSPAVLLGIHSNKASRREGNPSEVRGPSGLTDGVRAELHLYRDKKRLFLHAPKNNYAPRMAPPGVELLVGDHGVLRAAEVQSRIEDVAAAETRARAELVTKDTAAILAAFAAIQGGESTSIDTVVTRAGINLQRGRTAFRMAMEDGRIQNIGTSARPRYRVCVEPPHTPPRTSGTSCAPEGWNVSQRLNAVPDVPDVESLGASSPDQAGAGTQLVRPGGAA